MKLNLIFIMSFILSVTVYAQTDCDNDVKTDWSNPNNNSLPVDLTHPLGDIRYKNLTNWYPLTPGGNFEDYDLSNMVWSGTSLLEMDNIWSTSIPHYNYINQSPPPLPMNGWELLLINIGRYPNNTDILDENETFQAIPYIVIYNRYTGLMRVFLNFGLDNQVGQGPDAVQIELSIFDADAANPTKNGLLRLYEGKDLPLDQNTKVKRVTAVAKATNAQRQWMSADFQIAYDPCVCYYPSKMQFSFNQIQEENIILAGRSMSVDDDLINGQLKINPFDFLTGFDANGNDEANGGGILIYKGLQNVVDDYILRYEKYKTDLAVVNQHNKVVEHNLGALKMLKYMLTAVLTYGISGNAIDVSSAQATDWFASMNTEYGKFIQKANGTFDIEKILGIAKKILGSSAKTYIEQDFEKLPLPQEPDKARLPRVTYTEMKFQGKISQQQLKGGPWFYTPGTYGTEATKVLQQNGQLGHPILNTPYNYPVYNDVLGTFALLKTPKLTVSKRVIPSTVSTKERGIVDGSGYWTTAYYKSWTTEYQLRLSEDLMYAINSTLDIANTEIKAAFRFKAKNKILFLNGQEYNTFINPEYTTNVFSTNQDVDTYDMLRSFSNTPFTNDVYDGYGPVIGNWCVDTIWNGNQYTLVTNQACFRDEKPNFQTPFVPINAFYNTPAGIGFIEEFVQFSGASNHLFPGTQGLDLDFYDIELVLMIDTKYNTLNSKGQNNTNTQILSYDIPLTSVTKTNANLITDLNTTFDLNEQNENIELTQTHFSGQQVKNCKLTGSTYECRAWKDVVISGNITSDAGITVNIIAGNKIETEPTSYIAPTVNLYVQKALNENHPMPLSSQPDVTNFCQGANGQIPYKGNQAAIIVNLGGGEETPGTELKEQESSLDWDVTLYPNPSNGVTRLKLDNMESGKVTIQIVDITGKIISGETQTLSNSIIEVNLSRFDKGTYFIKVSSDNGTKTKRFILK